MSHQIHAQNDECVKTMTMLKHLASRSGRPQLDNVPGSGIVIPGGANIYYLDLAPHSASPIVRITPCISLTQISTGSERR